MRNWVVLAFVGVACWCMASAAVCSTYKTKYESVGKKETYSCGWWGWSRCTRTKYKSVPTQIEIKDCCTGSYGYVDTGCNGECSQNNTGQSSMCNTESQSCRDFVCDRSEFKKTIVSMTVNENDDEEILLLNATGTSFVQYTENGRRVSENVPFTKCSVVSTDNIAEVRQDTQIFRKRCTNTRCNPCGYEDEGCLDHSKTYMVLVECYAEGTTYTDVGVVQHLFYINVTEGPIVEFVFPEGVFDEPINVDGDVSEGSVVLEVEELQIPPNEAEFEIYVESPLSKVTEEPMFAWDDENGAVVVATDLSQEPDGTYIVQICVEQRRGTTCFSFNVTLVSPVTTTEAPTTTGELVCKPTEAYSEVPGFPMWCQSTCNQDIEFCKQLQGFCVCVGLEDNRINCTAKGAFEKNKHMDAWCYLNCNFGNYSYCPTHENYEYAYCECDEN